LKETFAGFYFITSRRLESPSLPFYSTAQNTPQ